MRPLVRPLGNDEGEIEPTIGINKRKVIACGIMKQQLAEENERRSVYATQTNCVWKC